MANQPYQPDPRTPPVYLPAQEPMMGVNDETVQVANAGGVYREKQHVHYGDPEGQQVEKQTDVYVDKNLQRANTRYWVTTILYFLLGVLEVIMGLRFLFRLLGASEGNNFIVFLYNLSHVFVAPFNGIFNDQTLGTSSVFELSTIIAMLIYALVFWGLVMLCRVIFSSTYDSQQRVVTTRRR